jgi:hypothetical protein
MPIVDPDTLQFSLIGKATEDTAVRIVWHTALSDDEHTLELLAAGVLIEKASKAKLTDGVIRHGNHLLEVNKEGGTFHVTLFQRSHDDEGAPRWTAVMEYLDTL